MEKAVVATETEAVKAESTSPTVNIQTTKAAKAEPVHTATAERELTVKTMSAEGKLDWAVVRQEDVDGESLGVHPEDPGLTGSDLDSEQDPQCAAAEVQPAAPSGSDSSPSDDSCFLSLAAEKDKGNKDCRFTVAPVYIRDYDTEEKLPSPEEEDKHEVAAEGKVTHLKEEGKHTGGKRVKFSSEVQYFEGDKFNTELEDGIEEVDEEEDESTTKGNNPDIWKNVTFEIEKYYHQTDSSEDEMGKEETDLEEEECGKEELQRVEGCVDAKAEVREDVTESEKEEGGRAEVLMKAETDGRLRPHHVTQAEILPADAALIQSPPAVSQTEVTLHPLHRPHPGHCHLHLPSCISSTSHTPGTVTSTSCRHIHP